MASVIDICNKALDKLGQNPIISLDDGNKAANLCARNWPLVRESWMQSGEIDFILKCVAPDLKTCQNFVIEQLTATPNVGQVRTSLTLRQIKNEPVVV